MRRATRIRLAILFLWLAAMGWILRYEARPEWFTRDLDGYRGLLSADMPMVDAWMRILFRDVPIGYSHSRIEVDDRNPLEYHQLHNEVHLAFRMADQTYQVRMDTAVALNMLYQLQSFSFEFAADPFSVQARGRRLDENNFHVEWVVEGVRQQREMAVPADAVVYSPMTGLALSRMRPGREYRIKTLDPASMGVSYARARALRREEIAVDGRRYDALVVEVEQAGVKTLSWLDDDGGLLRQETPIGLTLERCDPDSAFAAFQARNEITGLSPGVPGLTGFGASLRRMSSLFGNDRAASETAERGGEE